MILTRALPSEADLRCPSCGQPVGVICAAPSQAGADRRPRTLGTVRCPWCGAPIRVTRTVDVMYLARRGRDAEVAG